jgi:H2-forming N5,N10-methylenetetrahydromethanopterin dehydrogenase-like enzyme
VSIGLDEFGPLLLKVAEMRKGPHITTVFEVERTSTSLAVLLLIKNFAKYFAVYASVIIVSSEANAGLAFGDDKRHEIVWVDEMSAEVAEEYAKKLHPAVSGAELKLLFDKVGKLPLDILRSISAAQIIEEAILAVNADLVAFTLKQILTALKAAPDGVHVSAFDGVEYKGVDLAQPKKVAVALKETNCIVYHMPSKQYRLVSRAHRTALMQYKPPKGMFGW